MRRALFTLCLVVFACGYQSAPAETSTNAASAIQYSGGDGLTKATAIIISGAKNERDGVESEYSWVRQHLPGAAINSTAIIRDAHVYDAFDVTTASGEKRSIYFDITSFFGKR